MQFGCKELSTRYSQFVDGAAGPLLTDVIDRHLLTCSKCVAEVNEIRRVREAVGATQTTNQADDSLQSRLVSIAGEEANQPLALRRGEGPLPTRMQARKRLVAASVLFTVAAVLGWSAIGLTAAPGLLHATDLAEEDRADLVVNMGLTTLENPAVVAFLSASSSSFTLSGSADVRGEYDTSTPIRHPSAALTRAAAVTTPVRGEAHVIVLAADGYRSTAANVSSTETGATVELLDNSGAVSNESFVPRSTTRQHDWLAGDYTLAGWENADVVAGRSVSVIEASLPNRVVSRWWVDEATGIVVWQERYAVGGAVTLSAGYETFSTQSISATPASGGLVLSRSTSSDLLASSSCPAGWVCQDSIQGLPLLWRVADRAGDPTRVHSFYSDGVRSLSVVQRRGNLAEATTSAQGRYESAGMPAVVVWQSGNTVLSVTSSDCQDVAVSVADALPHDEAPSPDIPSRILAGWAQLLDPR